MGEPVAWQPRSKADRAKLAEMVTLYGPVTHPPDYSETWHAPRYATSVKSGWSGTGHCLWCGALDHRSGCSHRPGCGYHRVTRLAWLAQAIPGAADRVAKAQSEFDKLLAERNELEAGKVWP